MVICEVCGERPAEVKARIESSVLAVCSQCASAGNTLAPIQPKPVPRAPQAIEISAEEEVLAENYASKIRDARSAAGLTQDEFAVKLNINSAVLKAAESGKRLDVQTARRIEKALKIRLIEKV